MFYSWDSPQYLQYAESSSMIFPHFLQYLIFAEAVFASLFFALLLAISAFLCFSSISEREPQRKSSNTSSFQSTIIAISAINGKSYAVGVTSNVANIR